MGAKTSETASEPRYRSQEFHSLVHAAMKAGARSVRHATECATAWLDGVPIHASWPKRVRDLVPLAAAAEPASYAHNPKFKAPR